MNYREHKSQCITIQCLSFLKRIYPLIENLIPFLFFGSLISYKIHYFTKEFDTIITIAQTMYSIDHCAGGLKAIILRPEILNFIYAIATIIFDAVIISSYVIRLKPTGGGGRAQGFWERWFPIITILLPIVTSFTMLYHPLPTINDPLFHVIFRFQNLIYFLVMAGLFISFFGCIMSIFVLWKLKRSFSLMVEVRQLVTTGLYKYVRHPLYVAELIHALGNTLLFLNSLTFSVYILFFIMEMIRAKLEERKFLQLIPEYAAYKARTGFLFPKFYFHCFASDPS